MQTIVLAGTSREVYAWARAQERNLRTVRHVANASSISGRYFDAIVELPSFSKRRDRHAVNAALRALVRRKPSIERTVDSDWVMPERPVGVPAAKVDPAVFRFSNLPVPELPLAEIYAMAVKMGAEEDFEVSDTDVSDHNEDSNDRIDEPSETTPSSDPEVDSPAPTAETPEVTEDAPKVTTAVTSAAPKRKGRRTNEQKAYDEAKVAQEERPGDRATNDALIEAEAALRKRHPNDERLATLNGLDF